MKHYDRAWAEIDLDALLFNIESIRMKIGKGTKMIAVIKTDGYGHGADQIAQVLEREQQVWGYAVATAEEAFALRENGVQKPILVLGIRFLIVMSVLSKKRYVPLYSHWILPRNCQT